mmetsp:Transcript_1083/g.670  ORF Transcript_1083/g.670 Transcript_1083/m.670 type:complete len:102 (+) Transcript_1083:136-441(+)
MPQNGSDAHLSNLKNSFKQAANSLTQLYKQCNNSYNVAYQQGKQDAYEEVFSWFLSSNSGNFKNVSVNQFLLLMQQKLADQHQETQRAKQENDDFVASLMT